MNITIRAAVLEDCERIRPLQKEIADLHHDGRPDLFRTEARYFSQDAFKERLEDPKHTILIAETDEGQVVGYAFAWVISYRNHTALVDHDSFYIDDICVLNAFQRAGIGRRLLNAANKRLKNKAAKRWSWVYGPSIKRPSLSMKASA